MKVLGAGERMKQRRIAAAVAFGLAWLILPGAVAWGDGQSTLEPVAACMPDDMRGCPPVGAPVNVQSGNAWFDQTDAVIPGLCSGLVFRRSYNSLNAYDGRSGGFGRGWDHSYEQQLDVTTQRHVIRLKMGSGVPMYFEDTVEAGKYTATVPITEESWFVKLTNGT